MDTEQLITDNPHKQRNVDDIVRFLKTRVEKNPNYCLLLGAGCSVTSGIPSGGELINEWRKEVYYENCEKGSEYSEEAAVRLLKDKFSQWYSENNEYSALFEKKYDLPSQRRKFIETLVAEKTPSIGYAYLVNLVKNNYLNSIFTTNFDDLLNEAFYHYSDRRPMLCAHDSSVNSINLYSSRPKIIKLHGDYLFDDIKGSLRETESLEENTKNKLVETLKGQGLITVGYAGYDRSVMDVLSYLLRLEDHLSNGIYWCVRKGEKISEEVRKLLWREKVYYVIIDGFDEFFAELNFKLTANLPLEQNLTNNKTSKIIESYTTNSYLLNSQSPIIKSDIERLSKQKTKSNISRLIQELTEKDQISNLDDTELAALMTIETLIHNKDFASAIKQGQEELNKSTNREMQVSLLTILAKAYALTDENDRAIDCHERLKACSPNDPKPYISISGIEQKLDKKLSIIEEAIKVAPYEYEAYDKKAIVLTERTAHLPSAKKLENQATALIALEKSLSLNPSYANPSWGRMYDLINNSDSPKTAKKEKLLEIISKLDEQGPFNPRSVTLKTFFHSDYSDNDEQKIFFESLQSNISKVKYSNTISFKSKILKAAHLFKYEDESLILTNQILDEADENRDYKAIIAAAKVLAELFGDFNKSIKVLENLKHISDDYDGLDTLLKCQLITKDDLGAEKTLAMIGETFNRVTYLKAALEFYDMQRKTDDALIACKELRDLTNDVYRFTSLYAYHLIQAEKTNDARALLNKFLSDNSFDRNLTSEIVNFELCNKILSGKRDKVRLGELLRLVSSDLEKAAIHALLDEKEQAISHIRSAIKKDRTDITTLLRWPVFNDIRSEKDFIQIIESNLKPTYSKANSNNISKFEQPNKNPTQMTETKTMP